MVFSYAYRIPQYYASAHKYTCFIFKISHTNMIHNEPAAAFPMCFYLRNLENFKQSLEIVHLYNSPLYFLMGK